MVCRLLCVNAAILLWMAGILAVTRSLGDILMKDMVISTPFSTDYQLQDNDTMLIVACDGVCGSLIKVSM